MSDGGKGDARRPTDAAAYAEGWDRIGAFLLLAMVIAAGASVYQLFT